MLFCTIEKKHAFSLSAIGPEDTPPAAPRRCTAPFSLHCNIGWHLVYSIPDTTGCGIQYTTYHGSLYTVYQMPVRLVCGIRYTSYRFLCPIAGIGTICSLPVIAQSVISSHKPAFSYSRSGLAAFSSRKGPVMCCAVTESSFAFSRRSMVLALCHVIPYWRHRSFSFHWSDI
jgi:hypothetical protein